MAEKSQLAKALREAVIAAEDGKVLSVEQRDQARALVEATEKEAEQVIVYLGEIAVDITKLPVLTLKDKRELYKAGVDLRKIGEGYTPEQEAEFALVTLRKVRPQVTMEEVDTLSLRDLNTVARHAMQRTAEEVDRPS